MEGITPLLFGVDAVHVEEKRWVWSMSGCGLICHHEPIREGIKEESGIN